MSFHVGETVILNTPENPRLHNQGAQVAHVTEWGAHVRTKAAATGQFRALNSEMRPVSYTGNSCPTCGSMRMRPSGTCMTCEECGTTSGCG